MFLLFRFFLVQVNQPLGWLSWWIQWHKFLGQWRCQHVNISNKKRLRENHGTHFFFWAFCTKKHHQLEVGGEFFLVTQKQLPKNEMWGMSWYVTLREQINTHNLCYIVNLERCHADQMDQRPLGSFKYPSRIFTLNSQQLQLEGVLFRWPSFQSIKRNLYIRYYFCF